MKDSIKAGELRLGNWVKQAHATIRVLAAGQTKIIATDFNGHTCKCNIRNVQPIPLSKEVLEKCGFYCSDSRPVGADNTIMGTCISPFVDGEAIRLWVNDKNEYWFEIEVRRRPVWVKHLHTLQNLYFAITGHELEITL